MIAGWPVGVPFSSPSTISSLGNMRKLYDAWASGSARWVKLTTPTQLKDALADLVVEGHVNDARKERSDKGGTHKRKLGEGSDDEDVDKENAPSKPGKVARGKKATTSSSSKKPTTTASSKKKAKTSLSSKHQTHRPALAAAQLPPVRSRSILTNTDSGEELGG